MYRDVDPSFLPQNESLETTIARVVPYFLEEIKPQMKAGKRVILAAHGNSLRALVKYLDNLTPEEILEVNIPTGTPLVYEFDDDLKVIKHYYLGDQNAIAAKMNAVANHGLMQFSASGSGATFFHSYLRNILKKLTHLGPPIFLF